MIAVAFLVNSCAFVFANLGIATTQRADLQLYPETTFVSEDLSCLSTVLGFSSLADILASGS